MNIVWTGWNHSEECLRHEFMYNKNWNNINEKRDRKRKSIFTQKTEKLLIKSGVKENPHNVILEALKEYSL